MGQSFDSTPRFREPARELVDNAYYAIPEVLDLMDNTAGEDVSDRSERVVNALLLVQELEKAGHKTSPAHWAIHQMIVAGHLAVTGNQMGGVGVFGGRGGDSWFHSFGRSEPNADNYESFLVRSTPSIWTIQRPTISATSHAQSDRPPTVADHKLADPKVYSISVVAAAQRPDGKLVELHALAQRLLTFVLENQPSDGKRKLSAEEFQTLRQMEIEFIARCDVAGINVPTFPDAKDSGSFFQHMSQIGKLKIPYSMLGLDHPRAMLFPTNEWFQTMFTFVKSLELRANSVPCFVESAPITPKAKGNEMGASQTGIAPAPTADDFPGLHPLLQFQRIVERIIQDAPVAYCIDRVCRDFWDKYGSEGAERGNRIRAHLNDLVDESIVRKGGTELWSKLRLVDSEPAVSFKAIIDAVARAVQVPFPTNMARLANSDQTYITHLNQRVSEAAGVFADLRTVFKCVEGWEMNQPKGKNAGSRTNLTKPKVPDGLEKPFRHWPTFVDEMKAARKRPTIERFKPWLQTKCGFDLNVGRFKQAKENYDRAMRRFETHREKHRAES